jgi:hypothetical protein
LGSVETGKLADMVLLSKDPTVDINNAKSIVFVMKGGQIIDESRLPLAGGKQKRRFESASYGAGSPFGANDSRTTMATNSTAALRGSE